MVKTSISEISYLTSTQLTEVSCVACTINSTKIAAQKATELLLLIPNWQLHNRDNIMLLEREYTFKNYKLAWDFANKISVMAETEGHHPAILLEWGKVTVTWWTHTINGLHQNDFICAAKTDALFSK
ncbi:4a-hydroxytetrahydrobiopterin dehydratase [Colwellia echini]|uniref:Putative pterin-4-alpha-carbinolamine dehydratase n=1 Tax=Colwellia echini TaxID=1982103 RepID=A0ABY3MZJ8_9GAMM|nr:4a-hydroxytetrahydrobiopterin dehydratase [Colwellia echini]TYK66427.1 4a-hydroxytetrahydrobiopterin dehydratase [Colwellia echini]